MGEHPDPGFPFLDAVTLRTPGGLVASLLSVEPVAPVGLGATEPGIVLVFTTLGVAPAGAAAVALLNRVVNYASLAAAGPYVLPARRAAAAI